MAGEALLANREEWLVRASGRLAEWLVEAGETVPPMRVSVGWPGGKGKKSTVVGQCWPSTVCEDGVPQIFMTPARGKSDTVDVLGTLLHEMIHAVDDCESGHRGNFVRIAKAMGFVAKYTSSGNRSEELTERLTALAEDMGEFPHAAIAAAARGSEQPKEQTNRQLKVSCPNTGYIARTTRKWLDEYGAPSCPCCQAPMEVEVKDQ